MKVREVMTRDVRTANPGQSLQEVASEMERFGIGIMPVGENDRLVGMITDRDIAVRGISHGLGPQAHVGDVMSKDVCYCFEEDEMGDLASNMADERVRRLPVVNADKRLVGIVSLGDIATKSDEHAHHALAGISKQGGAHSQ